MSKPTSEFTEAEYNALMHLRFTPGGIIDRHDVLRKSEHPGIKAIMHLNDTAAEMMYIIPMVFHDMFKGPGIYSPEMIERWCEWLLEVDERIDDERFSIPRREVNRDE